MSAGAEREARVRRLLVGVPVPDQAGARERGWSTVEAAFADREPVPRGPARARRIAVAAVAALAAGAFALTPAGADVREWIADAISPGEPTARPLLDSLPAPGSLLVETPGAVWVQHDDGGRRLLDGYDHATWSPRGLFVAASDGRELVAVDPLGEVHWTLTAPGHIRAIDWSGGEGYRVAYVSDRSLRVVAGDGTGDRLVRPALGSRAIAWRPEEDQALARHELAFVDARGRVSLLDTDRDRLLWRSAPYGSVEALQWSADGRTLLISGSGFTSLVGAGGEPVAKGVGPGATGAALAPDGETLAAVLPTARGGAELALIHADRPTDAPQVLYRAARAGPSSFGAPSFSPDGRWVLLPWQAADQWLFVRTAGHGVIAVADISRQFDPDRRGPASFPEVDGWCC